MKKPQKENKPRVLCKRCKELVDEGERCPFCGDVIYGKYENKRT